MSKSGAIKSRYPRIVFDPGAQDDFFLPDLCAPRMVLAVVLISELLALTFALARPSGAAFLTDLARISLLVQWVGLTGAAVLCYSRRWLAGLSVPMAALAAFGLLLINTAILSEAVYWLGQRLSSRGFNDALFPTDRWAFLFRNEGICAVVTAMLLRYFFVAHQWRTHVRAEARSRIHALQARIRPHFLFNSMNTIASLTRTDPGRAEEAVEDLADLFRATLKDSESPLRMKEELELTRIYQRIEELRLADRLTVKWHVEALPMRAIVPSLTIQPLLENAIYHGIEPLDGGGTVSIHGRVDGDDVIVTVANPVANGAAGEVRPGNRLALDNIRQRLRLAYGERGQMQITETPDSYEVMLRFPYEE
jgi:two-component system sensor histidine kinase AlgZ